jgi:hypothetical protein
MRIILTMRGVTADAGIHNPVVAGLIDKVLDYLGGQDHLFLRLNRFVDRDHIILEQVDNVVSAKEHVIDDRTDDRQLGHLRQQNATGKRCLE